MEIPKKSSPDSLNKIEWDLISFNLFFAFAQGDNDYDLFFAPEHF